MKQVIPAVKGTRDFYPEQMAFRNWLYGKIKQISEKYGYQEFDGPAIEYLDLYSDKTSREILEKQAFLLKDRDNRDLILRPEITPTFARMVAQKKGQLPAQIRWYSFGKTWRYEQPQKGRGREFFQWELNILGPETAEADAEVLAIAAQYLNSLGITPDEAEIRVGSREFIEKELKNIDLNQEQIESLLPILDRREKMDDGAFLKQLQEFGLSNSQIGSVNSILDEKDLTKSPPLQKVFGCLKNYPNVSEYIVFDPKIIRGFDYYTGTVFEAWAKVGSFRALFGGGRFDNLTSQIGGDKVPGVGFAAGDMVIEAFLEELNKIPRLSPQTAKILVTVFNQELQQDSTQAAVALRNKGVRTELWVEPEKKLDKQLKYADQKGIPYVLIIGPEEKEKGIVTLKELPTKQQSTLSLDEAIAKLSS